MIKDVWKYMNIMRNGRNAKEPNGTCRTENTKPQIKDSLNELNSSSDTTEEINDLKNLPTQALQDEG